MRNEGKEEGQVASSTRVSKPATNKACFTDRGATFVHEAAAHSEKGKEHPEDVENAKAEGKDGRYGQRGHGRATVLVEDAHVVGSLTGEKSTVKHNGVHSSVTNTSGDTARGIVEFEAQPCRFRPLFEMISASRSNDRVSVGIAASGVTFFLLLFVERNFNDTFYAMVDRDKDASEDELEENTRDDGSQCTGEADEIKDPPEHGGASSTEEKEESSAGNNNYQLSLLVDNSEEQREEGPEGQKSAAKCQSNFCHGNLLLAKVRVTKQSEESFQSPSIL